MNPPALNRTVDFKLPTGILGAALGPDDDELIAGCMDGIYRARLSTKASQQTGRHSSYVSSAAWIPRLGQYVTAGYDGRLKWHQASDSSEIRSVDLHGFWSWDMAISPNQQMIASVTGQYLAGGYRYEPLPEREPSVKLLDADSGTVLHALPHVPSVQAVCFSNDSRFVAAGNLMGEVRVWDCHSGMLAASWTTEAFTSWGVIKSHCFLGGIFAMKFTPDDQHLLLAGMGPMQDPMAGNGRQLWQRWSWSAKQPQMLDETHPKEAGEGLMETLAIHPSGSLFAMGGRLRGGDWNVALFDLNSGNRLAILKTGYRVTEALFSSDGKRLILTGTEGQPKPKPDGTSENFGRIEAYELNQMPA
jgi:WD40 repeat protein